ncbi:MAG TPA: hypothetical protein ENJ82_15155 [Bacteroidetes bacterium]|nr:hypothetical protein [Bacteroidota bacterium]
MTEPIVIQKLKLDVYTDEVKAPLALLDQVMEALKVELLPLLEAKLAGFSSEGTHFLLDKLELDLRVEPGEDWKAAVSDWVREKLDAELEMKGDRPFEKADQLADSQEDDGNVRHLHPQVRVVQAWAKFLAEGVLPWWKESLEVSCLQDLLTLSADFPAGTIWGSPELLLLMQQNRVAVRRMSIQIPRRYLQGQLAKLLKEPPHLLQFFAAVAAAPNVWVQVLPALLRAVPRLLAVNESPKVAERVPWLAEVGRQIESADALAVWQSLAFLPGAKAPFSRSELAVIRERIAGFSALPLGERGRGESPVVPSPTAGTEPETGAVEASLPKPDLLADSGVETVGFIKPENEIYFAHAGLILLHPFFPSLFQNLGLQDQQHAWISDAAQSQAVYLLHSLATGDWEASEDQLFLPKLLCGFTAGEVLPLLEPIRFAEQLEAERAAILDMVQSNWKPMRACTWESLAVDFLQRPGKFSRNQAGHWKIEIESKTADVLLRFLGWGLSPVKYDWMEDFLMVEWK